MNICMFSPFSHTAPSSYRLLSFAKVLSKSGHDVTVILPCYDRYTGFKVDCLNDVDGVHLSNPFQFKTRSFVVNMLPYTFSCVKNCFEKKYDVIHILKPTPITLGGYGGKFLAGIPTIQDIDDLDHLIMAAENHSHASTWLMKQCEQTIPYFCDNLIVSCSPLKELYSKIRSSKKISIIPNGVFTNQYLVPKDNQLKAKYPLKEKVIIYVGSLNNEAQLRPLLLAMRKVVNQIRNVSCLIVGDGKARANIQSLANNLGLTQNFVFTGQVPHSMVPQFLSIADIGFACFPPNAYFTYASNIKVFEYMAAGLPVIVNPNGDLPLYIDYGKAGIICNPTVQELSENYVRLLQDEKKQKALAYHARVHVKNFDWDVLANRLLGAYTNMI
jgi:glycosyltransferase involved in cell wall biosynthesis